MSVNSFSGQPAIPTSYGFTAGKNKIINGDFGVWQRGTSFSNATGLGYTADRWFLSWSGITTIAVSRQSFTPGTAPVAGYEGSYFARIARTAGSADDYFLQRIEDCRTFAGQTVTVSFWAKANTATTISQVYAAPNAGSGGSGAPGGAGAFSGIAVTTSWARYSTTFTLNSLTGTTIGTGSYVELVFKLGSAMGNVTLDLWGVQLEAGATATSFQTATGNIQGELAACQRYYYKINIPSGYAPLGLGYANNTGSIVINISNPVTMRVKPTSLDTSATSTFYWEGASSGNTPTTIALSGNSSEFVPSIVVSKAATFTSGGVYMLYSYNTAAYLGFNAEL